MTSRPSSLVLLLGCAAFSATVDVPPSSPAVRIFARTYEPSPGDVQWGWSGSGASIAFAGTSCSALFFDRGAVVASKVDGVPGKVFDLSNSDDTLLALATGLAAGPHVVEFRQRTEAANSQARFHGFRIDGTPGTAPAASSRRIEFYGNSITCGYGVLDSVNSHPFSIMTEDEGRSFAGLAADSLQADHRTICWSGKGVIMNNGRDTVNPTLPMLHEQILPWDKQHLWDFSKWVPQVVVVNLGTNDYSAVAPDSTRFHRAYLAFVDTLHAHYPMARFVLLDGPMMSDNYPAGIDALTKLRRHIDNIVAIETARGISVTHVKFTAQNDSIGYGADWHPNRVQAARNAGELVAVLRPLLGWTGDPASLTHPVSKAAALVLCKGRYSVRVDSGSSASRARVVDSNGRCLRTMRLAPGSSTILPSYARPTWLRVEGPDGLQVLAIPPRLP